jgi:amino acid transporter, AAT family
MILYCSFISKALNQVFLEIISVTVLILSMHLQLLLRHAKDLLFMIVQGWSSLLPKFSAINFMSFYIEIPVMLVMYTAWAFAQRTNVQQVPALPASPTSGTPLLSGMRRHQLSWYSDLVDHRVVDLVKDEYEEVDDDKADDEIRERRMGGRTIWLWRLYYWVI